MIGWSPVDEAGEDGIGFELRPQSMIVALALWRRNSAGARGIDMIPRNGIRELAMGFVIEFASAPSEVSVFPKVLR